MSTGLTVNRPITRSGFETIGSIRDATRVHSQDARCHLWEDEMDAGFMEAVRAAVNEFLMWVGFGTVVGLTAKAIMPGRDPGGAIGTLLMGIVGCVIGCGAVMFFREGARVEPISPIGFCAATGGAFILLLFYRILAGSFFVEAEAGDTFAHASRRRRRRRAILQDT